MIILRGIGPLFCSLKREHASMNMPACTLFNKQNKGPNPLSISTWSVLGKQNVQADKIIINLSLGVVFEDDSLSLFDWFEQIGKSNWMKNNQDGFQTCLAWLSKWLCCQSRNSLGLFCLISNDSLQWTIYKDTLFQCGSGDQDKQKKSLELKIEAICLVNMTSTSFSLLEIFSLAP